MRFCRGNSLSSTAKQRRRNRRTVLAHGKQVDSAARIDPVRLAPATAHTGIGQKPEALGNAVALSGSAADALTGGRHGDTRPRVRGIGTIRRVWL